MKEYLKMADVFPNGVCVTGYDGRHNGWFSVDHDGDRSIDESHDGGYEEVTALHISHAINSHDELVSEVERLTSSLKHANSNHEIFERQYYLEMDKNELLQMDVERLRESLKWAVSNLPFDNAFEWSDEESADAHYAALKLLGVEIE